MNVTTKDLRSNVYGTPCGHSDICGTSLTHELVIEFIDIFFGGVLENVETGDDEETGGISIYGGEPILKKLTITNNEFDYFTLTISKKFKSGLISDISDYLDIPTKKFKDIENLIDEDKHPEIICWLFSELVSNYGGSFRCDYMDNGHVDLESE